MKKDGRLIASENEFRVLRALHRFGWLRSRDLAVLTRTTWRKTSDDFLNLSPFDATASNLRMIQITLRRLSFKREIVKGIAPNNSILYSISERGARRLRQFGIPAVTGKDLVRSFSLAQFKHRSIANAVAISAICRGMRVATEREVAQGRWFGGVKGIAGKKPDVLITDKVGRAWWCEVERSRKNAKDYAKLIEWIATLMRHGSGWKMSSERPERLEKVVFICTPAFQKKLVRDMSENGLSRSRIEALVVFETSLYNFEDIKFL